MGQSERITSRVPDLTVILVAAPSSLIDVFQTWQCATTCAIPRRTVGEATAPPAGAAASRTRAANAVTSGLRFIEGLLDGVVVDARLRPRGQPPVPAAG